MIPLKFYFLLDSFTLKLLVGVHTLLPLTKELMRVKNIFYFLINLFFLHMVFFFNFIFKLYIIVLVLPNIKMNPPQVYMCSPP